MAKLNNYNSSDLVSGVDNVSGKSGKKIAGITAGVLAVVAGGSAAAYGCSDYVRNQVNLRVMKPQSYYAWVNTNNVKESAKSAGDSYREFIKAIENGSSSNVDMKFELSDAAKDIIIDEALGGENEYTKNYVDIIRNIDTLSLNCKSDVKKGLSSATASLDLNGSRLATFDFASDSANADSFFRLEELTSKWAVFTLPEGETDEDQEKIMNAYKEFLSDPESVLSADEFEDVVERYITIWNRNVGDVTVEKKESVEIGDISVDYTVMTINMTDELAQNIAKDVINEAKNDAVIKKIVVDKLGICTDDEYAEKLDESLESIQDKDSNGSYTIRTYVDPKGVIRGTEVTDNNDEDNKAGFVIGKDGDVVRGKAFITGTDDDLSAVLSATDNGGKYTGNISITADGEDVSVEFKDFEVVNKEKCFCNGDVTVTADEKPVSITLRATNDSQTVSTDINVNGTEYGKFTMDISTDKSGSPEIPDKSSAFVIDPENDDLSIKDYVSQEETEKFLEGLFKGIGFKDDEAKSSAQSISSLFYFDFSSMYSDFDFDSDDYDLSDGDYEFNFDDSDIDFDLNDPDFKFDFDSADFDNSDLSLT